MRLIVEDGQTYQLRFRVEDEWQDGSDRHKRTTPLGLEAIDMGFPWGHIGAPFRRVVGARYLQPVAAIQPRSGGGSIYMEKLTLTREAPGIFAGEFTAKRTGRLSLFANDAVPPWPGDAARFYNRRAGAANRGTACVEVSLKRESMLSPLLVCDDAPLAWRFADGALDAELARLRASAK